MSYLRMSNMIKCIGAGDLNDLNSNSDNLSCIKAALVSSLYPNVIRFDKKDNRFKNEFEIYFFIKIELFIQKYF